MRRSISLARATHASVRAKKHLYDARIDEVEEYLGILRRKRDVLEMRMQGASEQIGDARDTLDQSLIPEVSMSSSDEDDDDRIPSDAIQLPPSSDNVDRSENSSSASSTDSPQFPITTSGHPSDDAGAVAAPAADWSAIGYSDGYTRLPELHKSSNVTA